MCPLQADAAGPSVSAARSDNALTNSRLSVEKVSHNAAVEAPKIRPRVYRMLGAWSGEARVRSTELQLVAHQGLLLVTAPRGVGLGPV